jgi:hypothetical protein
MHTSRAILVFSLFFLMGSTSWMLVNAIFLELPILMLQLPESYQLSYYLALSVQFGNIMLLVYLVIGWLRNRCSSSSSSWCHRSKISTNSSRHHFIEQIAVPFIIMTGVVMTLLIAFLWNFTQAHHSISLWILTAGAGAIGALSNLSFWSYAATYVPFCLVGLSTGMGCSSVVPAVLAAIQQPGVVDRFSVSIYFIVVALWISLGLVAFFLLNYLPFMEDYRRKSIDIPVDSTMDREPASEKKSISLSSSVSLGTFLSYLMILFTISCCNFFLPAVLPYFTLNEDPRIFTWILIVGMLGQPMGRCIHLALQNWHPRKRVFCSLTLLQFVLLAFYFILGRPLVLLAWLLIPLHFISNFLFGFHCTLLFQRASIISQTIPDARHFCRWLGCAEQIGACLSAILASLIGKFILFAS